MIEILSTARFLPTTPLLKQERCHPCVACRKSYVDDFEDLRDLPRGLLSEGATKVRGSVRYGFVATGFRGRRSRIQRRTLDSEFLHAAAQGVGMQIENLRGSTVAFNHPVGFLQNALDMPSFHLLQRRRIADRVMQLMMVQARACNFIR